MDKSFLDKLRCLYEEHLNQSLTPRTTVAMISIISLTASLADFLLGGSDCYCRGSEEFCAMRNNIYSLRSVLLTLFQAANILLLLGCAIENPTMMQIYIWYTLSFVVFGFVVTIMEFLMHIRRQQLWNFLNFLADVTYLFVVFWFLPLVDTYRKTLPRPSDAQKNFKGMTFLRNY